MTSILSSLDTVPQSLAAQQYALSMSQRNVANANNPNYTRQVAVFTPGEDGTASGAPSVSIQSDRDRFLDYSICKDLQSLGEQSTVSNALQQVDAIVSADSGTSLQQALSDFFNSFSSLSTAPEDMTKRQQVLLNANFLATKFQQLYSGIQQVQTSQDNALSDVVNNINSITAKIADLNAQIPAAQQSHSDSESTLRDSRQQLLEQLSSLTDISYFETESGSVTITTKQGGLLVAGNQSHNLCVTQTSTGSYRGVQLDGADITGLLESGQLGGLIKVRDNNLAGYLNTLDDMAATIISSVNEQHAQGSDLNGAAGGDFFTPFNQTTPGSNTGAARSMSVALSDPSLIAAASSGAGVGDNGNAQLLADIGNEKLFSSSTETFSKCYANLVDQIGSDEKAAEDGKTTQNNLVEQLKNQRDASFGVNMDEEAINIIKYQKAYQASAKYANILNTLSDDVLNILGT